MSEYSKLKNTGKDIDLHVNIYSLVEAVCVGFSVDRNTSIDLIVDALMDKRNNILEIITEIYELKRNDPDRG